MAALISPRRVARSERGAELIEFALVLPLLLFVVLGIVDFGFLFQRMEVVTNAAREGARVAVLPGYTAADARRRACDYLIAGGVPVVHATCISATSPNVQITPVPVPVPTSAAMTGQQVVVTFTHSYTFISGFTGWFGGALTSVPVRGVAIMRDEVPAGAGGGGS